MLDVDDLIKLGFKISPPVTSYLAAIRLANAAKIHRPRPYTMGADYTTWPGVFSHRWIGRHTTPEDLSPVLPSESEVADLFRRRTQMDGSPLTLMCPQGSTLLFISAAQWFTDSFLRTFGAKGPVDQTDSNHEVDLCQIYGLNDFQTDMLRERDPDTNELTHRLAFRLDTQGEMWAPKLFQKNQSGGVKLAPPFDGSLATGENYGKPLHDPCKLWNAVKRAHPGLSDHAIDQLLLDFHATGLDNGNGTIGYITINTLMLRAHNTFADLLWREKRGISGWDKERVFQTTRCTLIALLIKLVLEDYIAHIANMPFKLPVGVNRWQPWHHSNQIAIEFNLLYRWHSMIPERFIIDGAQVGPEGFRFNPRLVEQTGLAEMIRSLSRQPAARMSLRNTPDFLFQRPAPGAPAPVEATIALTRKARLPSLNTYRHHFCRKPHSSFTEMVGDQPFADELIADLSRLYCDVNRVELFPGLFAEQHKGDVIMGDLMTSMVAYDAITQLMNNPMVSKNLYSAETFSEKGFQLLKKTSSFSQVARFVGLDLQPEDCTLGRRPGGT